MKFLSAASVILFILGCSQESPAPVAPVQQAATIPLAPPTEVAATVDAQKHAGHDHSTAPATTSVSAVPAVVPIASEDAHAEHASMPKTDSILKKKVVAAGNLAESIADPFQFENPEARETYQNAKLVADRLDKMYCYCRCKENEQTAHKSLLTCFQDDHAAHCGICLREAQQAFLDWKDEMPLEVTVKAVDLMYNQGKPAPSMP